MRGSLSVFMEGGKLSGQRGVKPSEQGREPTTNCTCDVGSGNRARATVVGGERSHHCANPAPPPLPIKIVYMTGEFDDQLAEQKLFEAIVFTPCMQNLFLRYMVQMYLVKISDEHPSPFDMGVRDRRQETSMTFTEIAFFKITTAVNIGMTKTKSK